MNVFALVSAGLLAVMLFWAIYHARILFAGIRGKRSATSKTSLGGTEELPKFSLIVPAKDEQPVIHRCLDALMKINYPKEKMEIIVAAGNSKDATREICLDFSKKHPGIVKVVCEGTSKGKPEEFVR